MEFSNLDRSRQEFSLGKESTRKLRECRVLVLGVDGVGAEIGIDATFWVELKSDSKQRTWC